MLRYQPWLRFVDNHNISSILLEYTDGNVFVAFNTINQQYEVHSVKSFYMSGFSQNAVIEPEYINGFLYTDYRANELRKFADDVQHRRMMTNSLYDRPILTRDKELDIQLKSIERTLGTQI